MSYLRLLSLWALFLVPISAFAGKDKDTNAFDWRPIQPWETQIKDVPGNPGAPAIQLYYGLTRDDPAQFEFIYRRIKVLNEKGIKEHGDVEIELGPDIQLADIKARTIHPDGTIVDFDGHIFDKTILKTRGSKIQGKSFSFKDVTVGSILEYKYRLTWRGDTFFYSIWLLQQKLFTSREEFRFKPYSVIGRVMYAYLNQMSIAEPTLKNYYWQLDLENVPGVAEEEYAPPDDQYKSLVLFYYGGKEIASPDAFWSEVTKFGTQYSERFIGNFKEVQELATQAIAGESDPEKKLRKLYVRAQQIRNLSYEHSRTKEELKKEGLMLPENAADVIKRQYGTHLEINRLFVALARAAGFNAALMRVANRGDLTFNKNLLFGQQLDLEIAAVELNGKTIFLDPGTRFCPYGLVQWPRTAVPALRLGKDGGGFVDIPAVLPSESTTSRTIEISVDPSGQMNGDLTVEFRGEEALEQRLAMVDSDEAGRRKTLEEQIVNILPQGATAKLKDLQGLNDEDAPLVAKFSLEIPAFAAVTGKRLIAPAYPFQSRLKTILANGDRKAAIVFPFAFATNDTVKIKVPAGYMLESPPRERKTALYDAKYQILHSVDDSQLVIKRDLSMNGIRFDIDRFAEMKGFFDVVQAGDDGRIVFQQGGSAAKQ